MLNISFIKFIFKIFSPTFCFLLGFKPLTASVLIDTDGDGMTDVAELKYGFDPNDSNSFPQSFYVGDVSEMSQSLDGKLGTEDDIVYFSFKKYSVEDIKKNKDFINKVLPIMYYRLGHPANTMNVRFWKRYTARRGWMTIPNENPYIMSDGRFHLGLIVHELFHAWSGSHNVTCRTPNIKLGKYNSVFSGWEETAHGVAQDVLFDYLEAYPTDSLSSSVKNHIQESLQTGNQSKFDLVKNLKFTQGGTFFVDGMSSNLRYSLSAGIAQIMMGADEQF